MTAGGCQPYSSGQRLTMSPLHTGLFSPEDWTCPGCANRNWARRNTCNQCNTPKPGTVDTNREGTGGGFKVGSSNDVLHAVRAKCKLEMDRSNCTPYSYNPFSKAVCYLPRTQHAAMTTVSRHWLHLITGMPNLQTLLMQRTLEKVLLLSGQSNSALNWIKAQTQERSCM